MPPPSEPNVAEAASLDSQDDAILALTRAFHEARGKDVLSTDAIRNWQLSFLEQSVYLTDDTNLSSQAIFELCFGIVATSNSLGEYDISSEYIERIVKLCQAYGRPFIEIKWLAEAAEITQKRDLEPRAIFQQIDRSLRRMHVIADEVPESWKEYCGEKYLSVFVDWTRLGRRLGVATAKDEQFASLSDRAWRTTTLLNSKHFDSLRPPFMIASETLMSLADAGLAPRKVQERWLSRLSEFSTNDELTVSHLAAWGSELCPRKPKQFLELHRPLAERHIALTDHSLLYAATVIGAGLASGDYKAAADISELYVGHIDPKSKVGLRSLRRELLENMLAAASLAERKDLVDEILRQTPSATSFLENGLKHRLEFLRQAWGSQ